ncbi:MAG: hypothetical protein ACQESO_01180 [Bacillota bacterium]
MNTQNNAFNFDAMEYCYCYKCNKIRESADLVITKKGLQCSKCGGYDLGEAGWVACPYQKMSAVKCPRAGKGIVDNGFGLECTDRCFFRI